MDNAPKSKRPPRKDTDGKGIARARGKESAKRFLAKVKVPPPHGFRATTPGSPPPDERKTGTREHGSPDARGDRVPDTAVDSER